MPIDAESLNLDAESFRRMVVEKVREWADTMPDAPLVGTADSGQKLTPRDIAEQVAAGTPFGQRFANRWINLAFDHIASSECTPQGGTGASGII